MVRTSTYSSRLTLLSLSYHSLSSLTKPLAYTPSRSVASKRLSATYSYKKLESARTARRDSAADGRRRPRVMHWRTHSALDERSVESPLAVVWSSAAVCLAATLSLARATSRTGLRVHLDQHLLELLQLHVPLERLRVLWQRRLRWSLDVAKRIDPDHDAFEIRRPLLDRVRRMRVLAAAERRG